MRYRPASICGRRCVLDKKGSHLEGVFLHYLAKVVVNVDPEGGPAKRVIVRVENGVKMVKNRKADIADQKISIYAVVSRTEQQDALVVQRLVQVREPENRNIFHKRPGVGEDDPVIRIDPDP